MFWVNYTATITTDIEAEIPIHSIEVTQAIQQWQTLTNLKDCLQAGITGTCQAGEPPVPIIANKPAVLRVYMNEVAQDTTYTVEVSGSVSASPPTITSTVEPGCGPENQRRWDGACRSFDFYFTPPAGQWNVTVTVLDSSGNQLETEPFSFSSRTAQSLVLDAVWVCDALVGTWQCGPATVLPVELGLIRKLFPTSSVTAQVTNDRVLLNFAPYPSMYPSSSPDDVELQWWVDMQRRVAGLYQRYGAPSPGQYVNFHGIVRPDEPGTGSIKGIGVPSSHAVATQGTVTLAGYDDTLAAVAHENGHTLGTNNSEGLCIGAPCHTDTVIPDDADPPGGCWAAGKDHLTWPFIATGNYIQSQGPSPVGNNAPPIFEVGFDVTGNPPAPVLGDLTFELMGYCAPSWISPFTYGNAMNSLGVGTAPLAQAVPQISALPAPQQTSAGNFWTISGVISNGAVNFDPLFQQALNGPTDSGSGSYQIQVQGASGSVLFTRQFEPWVPQADLDDFGDPYGPPMFTELVPVQATAAKIVVLDPSNIPIGTVNLTGASPSVALTAPAAGANFSGAQNITWTISDPDSTAFTTRVLYSDSSSGNWSELGDVESVAGANSLAVDFDTLPGGTAQIMLLVSDGVNTGRTTSAPFTVPKKSSVTAQILSPSPNAIFKNGTPVTFQVNAYDVDDGVLDGSAVQWTSNLNGALGTGANLGVTTLHPGQHQITVTATDSDGNVATQTVSITVAGAGPTINLSVAGSQAAPTTCAQVSIQAAAGSVPLSQVAYSLNSGMTWTGLLATTTPLTFTLPGSGAFYVIAHAIDVAGQLASKDAQFSTTGACQSLQSLPPLANVNAASFSSGPLAAQSLVTVFGSGLAAGSAAATSVPLPTSLDGTTVTVTDSSGSIGLASLFYVSPGQLNYQIPAGLATGAASLAIANSNGSVSIGTLQLVPVEPGLFSANANGKGVAAAIALLVAADGTQTPVPVFQCSTSGGCVSVPIDLGPSTDQLVLEFYGTGIRGVSTLANVTCTVGSASAQVLYAGAQGQYVGLDQVNVIIPHSLAGSGEVAVSLVVDGQAANPVTVNIK